VDVLLRSGGIELLFLSPFDIVDSLG